MMSLEDHKVEWLAPFHELQKAVREISQKEISLRELESTERLDFFLIKHLLFNFTIFSQYFFLHSTEITHTIT